MKNIFYRDGFKGQLEEDYTVRVAIYPPEDVHGDRIDLLKTGLLTIRQGYAWDYDTCAIDTRRSKRASLVHDALYRLMNFEKLSWKWKPAADYEYYRLLVEDKFWKRWAGVRFKAVSKYGGSSRKTAHELCSAPDKSAVHKDTAGAS